MQSNNIWPEGKSGQNSLDEFWGREPFFGSGVLKVPQIVEGGRLGAQMLDQIPE